MSVRAALLGLSLATAATARGADLPLVDAHIHYSHDAWEIVPPKQAAELLRKHRNLWADLAFRSDHGAGGKPPPEWRAAFVEFPGRFMVGNCLVEVEGC